MARKYVYWTTAENRLMKEAHVGARPSVDELCAMFPLRSRASVQIQACYLLLRTPLNITRPKQKAVPSNHRWLRKAHEHFARREAGLLA